MALKSVTWADFTGGQYGTLGPFNAPPGTVSSINMVTYRDGTLGPRPGLKLFATAAGALSGLSIGIDGNAVAYSAAGHFVRIYVNTGINTIENIGGTPIAGGRAFASSSTPDGGLISVGSNAALGRLWDVRSLGGVTEIGNADTVTYHNGYVFGASLTTVFYAPYGLAFANTFTPPAQPRGFFNLIEPARAVVSMRGSIYFIGQRNVYELTGGLPPELGGTLRKVLSTRGLHRSAFLFDPRAVHAAASGDDGVISWTDSTGAIQSFAGASMRTDDRLAKAYGPNPPSCAAELSPLPYAGDKLLLNSAAAYGAAANYSGMWDRRGAWWPIVWSSSLPSGIKEAAPDPIATSYGAMLLDGAALTNVYTFASDADGPGLKNGAFPNGHNRIGDASDTANACSFDLPAFVAPNANSGQVQKVIVDGFRWNTGHTQTNHFDLSVIDAHEDRRDERTTAVQSFDQAVALAGATTGAKSSFRAEFRFPAAYAGEFQLRFANVRGVSFKRITVVFDERGWEG